MTEEEYFRKNFPDSCYGDKPLSPYWDYFQYGVEFGEQESEKQIKELEQKLEQTEKDLADYQFNYPTIQELEAEVKEWKDKAELWCKTANLKDHNIMINKELQKENADLKEEINKIAFARGNLEEENAELKNRNAELKGMYAHSAREAGTYKQFLELKEKENAELKDYRLKTLAENQTDVQKYAVNLEHKLSWYDEQLLKAKELLERLLITSCNSDVLNILPNCSEVLRVRVEAEQFLNSEGEK